MVFFCEIECYPITDFAVVAERSLVVFADGLSLVAYGADGICWRTRRLVFDELRILGVEGECLRVSGWGAGDAYPEFTVRLTTGEDRQLTGHRLWL